MGTTQIHKDLRSINRKILYIMLRHNTIIPEEEKVRIRFEFEELTTLQQKELIQKLFHYSPKKEGESL